MCTRRCGCDRLASPVIGILVAAFRAGILWGLFTFASVFLLPPLVLVFVVLRWHSAKVPFLGYLAGWAAWVGLIVL
jgi:hypothetical protein